MQVICKYLFNAAILISIPVALHGAEPPYFVTYSQQLEEPGILEIEFSNVLGKPEGGNLFLGTAAELEYGLTGWWTTELYLDGQATGGDSTIFTAFRWENRLRPLRREHWINPVFYLEFEDINGADKSPLEVVGHDSQGDLAEWNAQARGVKQREMEGKLLLSGNFKGWNVSENFILEKNLAGEPLEFGYAAGVSRAVRLAARPEECVWCAENFRVGLEFYGGLGTWKAFGLADTAHYAAPVISWELPSGVTLKVSPGFGLTGTSAPFLLRFGVSYEINQFGRALRGLGRER